MTTKQLINDLSKTRNFTVIAHIDHGKTTLLDKILEKVGLKKLEQERVTDTLDVEQEKGITVKMQPISFKYKGYTFNVIDTPGHIDFTYEVSRALKAVSGAILLVDVTKGIQAQTIENLLKALENELTIIPVLSKVDMAGQNLINQRLQELKYILDIDPDKVILTSGHTGIGIDELLDRIITDIPEPKLNTENIKTDLPYALVVDLKYDSHLGMISTVRVYNKPIIKDQELLLVNENSRFTAKQVGIFTPQRTPTNRLEPGSIGYIATGIKETDKIFIGETISTQKITPIKGYKRPNPLVFASLFPSDPQNYTQFKDAIYQLALNDSGLQIKQIKSSLLGRGYRLGCLGTLHLEIVKERLEREFNIHPILTMPSVEYKLELKDGKIINISSPSSFVDPSFIKHVYEPVLTGEIITPNSFLSPILEVVKKYRGTINTINQYQKDTVNIDYYTLKINIPLESLIQGFFSALLQASKGYASFAYTDVTYQPSQVAKVDILVNKEAYPELSFLTYPTTAREKALKILQALKQTIPPSIVHIPLQATIGGKIIARETIRAYRKNVTAKLYGGDVRRKLKLLHKQAKLKKMRQQHIKIKIPPEAFLKAIKSMSNVNK